MRKIIAGLSSRSTASSRTRRMISSETFKTGVLNLVYGPAKSTGDATYEDAKVHLSQPEQWNVQP